MTSPLAPNDLVELRVESDGRMLIERADGSQGHLGAADTDAFIDTLLRHGALTPPMRPRIGAPLFARRIVWRGQTMLRFVGSVDG